MIDGGEPAEPLQYEHDAVPPSGTADASLTDDVMAMYHDGKTYVQAELAFQKTRAAFTLEKGKSGAAYLAIALSLVHLALIALVVGLVIALTPLITAWGATAVVTGLLIIGALVFAKKAKARFDRLAEAYGDKRA